MSDLSFPYSLIIPVYNRPEEIEELLASLCKQSFSDFEVIIVEDGSTETSQSIIATYSEQLEITYIQTANGGPSKARNKGAKQAKGQYLIVLDSDVVLPPNYLKNIDQAILRAEAKALPIDAFGGPDAAHSDFSKIQKAINYSMTSFLTTGGIRGGKHRVSHYYPRSFNLGCRRSFYEQLNGFDENMRYGEDLDFSMRLHKAGARTVLLPEAFVYHKRRVSFGKFFQQVHKFGAARISITEKHKGSLRLIHLLPSFATIGLIILFFMGFYYGIAWGLILLLSILFFVDAFRITHSLSVAFFSIFSSFIQIIGYGTGLLRALFTKSKIKNNEKSLLKSRLE